LGLACGESAQHASQHGRYDVIAVKTLIESYFKVVRKKVADSVPKTIMFLLVNYVRDALEHELISEIFQDKDILHLMKENVDVSIRRNKCLRQQDILRSALEILNEIRSDVRT